MDNYYKKSPESLNLIKKLDWKPYIDMSNELRKSAKKKKKEMFEKSFLKLINYSGFGETMKNVRKQRYQTCNKQSKKKLLWYQNQTIIQRYFFRSLLVIGMRKKSIHK